MNSKIETYIGFAIKKGAAVFGCDQIEAYRKKMFLVLYTESLSDNSLKTLTKTAEKRNCPICKIEEYELLKKRNCKALAICDKSLANAITENLTLVVGR